MTCSPLFADGARIDPVKATFRRIDSRLEPAGDRKAGGGSSRLEKARGRQERRNDDKVRGRTGRTKKRWRSLGSPFNVICNTGWPNDATGRDRTGIRVEACALGGDSPRVLGPPGARQGV